MTGKIISGTQAFRLGLVTSVWDDPMDHAEGVAKDLLQRSPDALACAKDMFQRTWLEGDEGEGLKVETEHQKKLFASYNQMASSGRAFGWNVPYIRRKEK